MTNETNENLDSTNEDKYVSENLDDFEDITALKEKYKELEGKHIKTSDLNRQLFERAKKAEGFEKNHKGEWVKAEAEPKEPKTKKTEKSDDKLLERLDKMALQVAGIKEADEVELYNNWKEQTGREADAIVGNDIFKKELENIRTAKANQVATSDIKGEQGKSGAKDNPDYWIAKATKDKDGKLLFPEETPKELYSKILDKIAEGDSSTSENLKFYNE